MLYDRDNDRKWFASWPPGATGVDHPVPVSWRQGSALSQHMFSIILYACDKVLMFGPESETTAV